MRFDIPCIGPQTLETCAAARIAVLAFEAGPLAPARTGNLRTHWPMKIRSPSRQSSEPGKCRTANLQLRTFNSRTSPLTHAHLPRTPRLHVAAAWRLKSSLFTHENDKPTYRATLGAVAEARKVRPVFLERQPKPQQHAAMLATLTRPALEMVAGNLIRVWLFKKYKTMLVDFLDALEIKNEDGVVEDLPESMDDAKLKAAVDGIVGKYPPEVVAVYLHAFNDMNEANWSNLKSLLEADPRLQLGAQS